MIYLDLLNDQYPDWHANAVCHPDNGHDPALWYPSTPSGGRSVSPGNARKSAARPGIELCNTCPVRRRCFDDAKGRNEEWGIWGGVDFEGARRARKEGRDAA